MARQSIATKYLGPTNFRGSRVKATSSGGLYLTLSWDNSLGIDENHAAAARALATKLGWKGTWHAGGNQKGVGNVFVLVDPLDTPMVIE